MAKSPEEFSFDPFEKQDFGAESKSMQFTMPEMLNSCFPDDIIPPDKSDLQATYNFHAQLYLFHKQAFGSHFKKACEQTHYSEALEHGRQAEELYLKNEERIKEDPSFKKSFKEFLSRHVKLELVNERRKKLSGSQDDLPSLSPLDITGEAEDSNSDIMELRRMFRF